jgi:hypothetical protein
MISRRRHRTFLCGLVTAFVSRNNDLGGYWAPGVLCAIALERRELELHGVVEDLAGPCPVVLAGRHCHHLDAVIARNHDAADLRGAALAIDLRFSDDGGASFANGLPRYRGRLALTMNRQGTSICEIRDFVCWPHDPRHEYGAPRR